MRIALTAFVLLAAVLVACDGDEEVPDATEQSVVGTAEVTFQYPVSNPTVYPECHFGGPCATRDKEPPRQHTGVDLTSTAPEVRAVLDGRVVRIVINGTDEGGSCHPPTSASDASLCGDHGMGNVVVVFHEAAQLYTLYGHMEDDSIRVSEGQEVSAGTTIGRVGATAYGTPDAASPPHLHFEIKEAGVLDSPLGCTAPDWGYVDEDPASCGYRDPEQFLLLARSVAAAPTPTPGPTATPSPTPTSTPSPTATPTPSYRSRLRVVTTSDWTTVSLVDGASWEQQIRISVSDEATNASFSPDTIHLNQPLSRADSGGSVETVFEFVVTDLTAGSTVEFEIARGDVGETRVEIFNYVTAQPTLVAMFVSEGITGSPPNSERFRLDADLLTSTAPPTPTPAPSPTATPTPTATATLAPTSSTSVSCGDGTFTIDSWDLPTVLTDQEQQASVVLTYRLPADASLTYFILAFETSVRAAQVSSDDILAAFPEAKVFMQGGTFSWSAIAHYVFGGNGESPLIADGQEHVLELTIPMPSESAYDEKGSRPAFGGSGWLWSYFSPLPFALLDQPPSLSLFFESGDGRWFLFSEYRDGAYTAQPCFG